MASQLRVIEEVTEDEPKEIGENSDLTLDFSSDLDAIPSIDPKSNSY